MVKFTEFDSICRLCLKKLEGNSVNLFSNQKITRNPRRSIKENAFSVSEMVETFCSIKIREGDGLPESVCSQCLHTVSSMKKLQMVSLKSDHLLNNILSSHDWNGVDKSNQLSDTKQMQIEFVDAQPDVKNESLVKLEPNSSVDNSTLLQHIKSEPIDSKKSKEDGKYKYDRKISCEMCGKLVEINRIEFHLNIHKDIRPYKCKVEDCEKHFTSPAHAKNHYKKVHVYSITRPHKCEICGRGFVQKSSLDTHKTYHFDPQIPCSICGQLYRNTKAMKKHLLVHSGERKFSCTECKKSFQTGFTLKIHMRTHTLEKPFSCTDCPKQFAYKCLLKGHVEKHHPKENGSS